MSKEWSYLGVAIERRLLEPAERASFLANGHIDIMRIARGSLRPGESVGLATTADAVPIICP